MKKFMHVATDRTFEMDMPNWFFRIFSYLIKRQKIRISSAKTSDKLRGKSINIVYYDEYTNIKESK